MHALYVCPFCFALLPLSSRRELLISGLTADQHLKDPNTNVDQSLNSLVLSDLESDVSEVICQVDSGASEG